MKQEPQLIELFSFLKNRGWFEESNASKLVAAAMINNDEDVAVRGALRLAVYKRLAGSLGLYLGFLTLLHLFWTTACAVLEPPGGVAISVFGGSGTQAHSVSLVTALEIGAVGLYIVARFRSTFCAVVGGFVVPLLGVLVVFVVRLVVSRGGVWYDEAAYGGSREWSNAKASHIAAAYARAYYGHTMWSGFVGWVFLMGAGVLSFYGKYHILAAHRSVQQASAKVFRIAQVSLGCLRSFLCSPFVCVTSCSPAFTCKYTSRVATSCAFCFFCHACQSGACCLLPGDYAPTFFFVALHVAAGGVVAAVLSSSLGFNDRLVDPATGQLVEVYDRMTM